MLAGPHETFKVGVAVFHHREYRFSVFNSRQPFPQAFQYDPRGAFHFAVEFLSFGSIFSHISYRRQASRSLPLSFPTFMGRHTAPSHGAELRSAGLRSGPCDPAAHRCTVVPAGPLPPENCVHINFHPARTNFRLSAGGMPAAFIQQHWDLVLSPSAIATFAHELVTEGPWCRSLSCLSVIAFRNIFWPLDPKTSFRPG